MNKKLVKKQMKEGYAEGHTHELEKVLKGSPLGTVLANIFY